MGTEVLGSLMFEVFNVNNHPAGMVQLYLILLLESRRELMILCGAVKP